MPLTYPCLFESNFAFQNPQVYREHMRKHPESTNMGQDILSEWADMTGNRKEIIGDDPISKATQYQTLKDIVSYRAIDCPLLNAFGALSNRSKTLNPMPTTRI